MSSTFTVNSNKSVTFLSKRLLDTKDAKDYAIPFDNDLIWSFAYSTRSPNFNKHAAGGWFAICFGSNGSIGERDCPVAMGTGVTTAQVDTSSFAMTQTFPVMALLVALYSFLF